MGLWKKLKRATVEHPAEALIGADFGVATATALVEGLKESARTSQIL